MAYIEVHQALLAHRKTYRLARLTVMDRFAVVGRLIALWSWAVDSAPDGDLGSDFPDVVGDVMGWSGDPVTLVDALVASGFIERDGDTYLIHDWEEYAGRLIERRKENAERMRVARANKRGTPTPPPSDDSPRTRAPHVQDTFNARAGARVPYPTVADRSEPDPELDHGSTGNVAEARERAHDDGGALVVLPANLCSKVARAAHLTASAEDLSLLLEQHRALGPPGLELQARFAAEWIANPKSNPSSKPMTLKFLSDWYERALNPPETHTANGGNGHGRTNEAARGKQRPAERKPERKPDKYAALYG